MVRVTASPVHVRRSIPAEQPPHASVRRLLLAVVVVAVAYVVVASHVIPGGVVMAAVVVLLVAAPTSATLHRRVACNVAVLVGWAPVIWWVRLPVHIDHAAALLALALGALVWWLCPAAGRGERRRRLVPRLRPVDGFVVAASLAALLVTRGWAFPGSARAALRSLVPAVDDTAHFNMFATIRDHGATTRALGHAPDGSSWVNTEYPQGFHSLVATVAEWMHPHVTSGTGLVTAYTEAVAVVVVLVLAMLVAAIVSLPGLDRRPLVALPVVVLTCTAFLWIPGQIVLADGFANFWVASAAAATSLVLALRTGPPLATAQVVAIAGLQVAVAWAWAPLVLISAPAVLALLVPMRTTFSSSVDLTRRRWALAVLAASALLVAWAGVNLLLDVGVSSLVTATGGITSPSPAPTFILILVGLPALFLAPRLVGADTSDEMATTLRRMRVLSLSVVAGVAVTVFLLVAQELSLGDTSYYLFKFVMGFGLILAGLVPAACGVLVAQDTAVRERLPRLLRVVLGLLLAVGATQFFGRPPSGSAPLEDESRAGTASLRSPYSSERLSDGVLAAVRAAGRSSGFEYDYLAIGGEGAVQAFYPDTWFHAITVSESADSSARMVVLKKKIDDVAEAAGPVRRLLLADPHLRIIVAPQHVAPLRARLGARDLARRVVTWTSVQAEGER